MATDGERIARVETLLSEIRADVRELKDEESRTRRRLHDAEGLLGALVDQEKSRRRAQAENQRKVRLRLEILTAVVAFAALFEPFAYHLVIGG